MTKTPTQFCPKHSETALTYNRKAKMWYCEKCLYGSYLTHQAQLEAQKRYNRSQKHKLAEKRYEKSKSGTEARSRYLTSDKYKAARARYDALQAEALRMSKQAGVGRGEVERLHVDPEAALLSDIRDFFNTWLKLPKLTDIQEWGEGYHLKISREQAIALIDKAIKNK